MWKDKVQGINLKEQGMRIWLKLAWGNGYIWYMHFNKWIMIALYIIFDTMRMSYVEILKLYIGMIYMIFNMIKLFAICKVD